MHQSAWAEQVKKQKDFPLCKHTRYGYFFQKEQLREWQGSGAGPAYNTPNCPPSCGSPAFHNGRLLHSSCYRSPTLQGHSPFIKPECFKRKIDKCHLNRVESIWFWPSETKKANSIERPLGSG